MSIVDVMPGMHKLFNINIHGKSEQGIIRKLSGNWYLTRSGEVKLSNARYSYILMKPLKDFSEMFNIDREILCVFSAYENFEPRSIDIFDKIFNEYRGSRIENVCRVLISKDSDVDIKVKRICDEDPESPIVIPFTYNELYENYSHELIYNKFRKNYFSRNLFEFLSPLKKDIYFFGRSSFVNDIVDRHKSGEHSGVFGLRKSGKTSIVYAIERSLEFNGYYSLSFDCETPATHGLRWYELLKKVVSGYKKLRDSNIKIDFEGRYTEGNAAENFYLDMLAIYSSKKRVRTLLIFDEIERITPGTASSKHWNEDLDFIYFWQTLRAFYQSNTNVLTYLVVGTNPKSVEESKLLGQENPIFASIPPKYIPCFENDQVTEMVKSLGAYMGLNFNSEICAKLNSDFGGHPFLIRQMCSHIHKKIRTERPVTIDKSVYRVSQEDYELFSDSYLEMMVGVLRESYPEEYEMLAYLANSDYDSFNEIAFTYPEFVRHLIGYGLIQNGKLGYELNLEVLKKYILKRDKRISLLRSNEEQVSHISSLRNKLERDLRDKIKSIIKTFYGSEEGKKKVIAAIPQGRREKFNSMSLNELLHKTSSPLYFLELVQLIQKEWSILSRLFDKEKKDTVTFHLEYINEHGRPEAHAKEIARNQVSQLEISFPFIQKFLDDF